MEQLLELIRSHLPEGEAQFPEDQLSTAPMKFMAAEIIREKLFEKLYQEVPYSVAVDVEVWDEEDDRVLIHAAIYVAKPSPGGGRHQGHRHGRPQGNPGSGR